MECSVVCAFTHWKKFRRLGCAWSGDPSHRQSTGGRRRTCGTQRVVLRVFCVGQVLELGSGLQISKLAWELVLGLMALRGPLLKLERPTPFAFVGSGGQTVKLGLVGHLIKVPVKKGFGD